MNALIVLAALVSVAVAVPYGAPIVSHGYSINSYAAPVLAAPIVKTYAHAPIISHASYATPVLASPVLAKSYIGGPVLAGPAVYGNGLGLGLGHGLYGGYGGYGSYGLARGLYGGYGKIY